MRHELDLSAPLRQHLTECGFDVRSEVNACDLVARKPDLLVVVELKRHLSFDLLAQAVERQSYADAVYVAIPKPTELRVDKNWRAKLKVLRRLGLGLFLIGGTSANATVEEALAPGTPTTARPAPRKRTALEREFANRRLDLNTGGSHGIPLVTAYREAALYVAHLLSIHGPLTSRSLRELGAHPRKTYSILTVNVYGWFARAENKCFDLSEAGREALVTYEPLIRIFRETSAAAHSDPRS